MPNGHRSIWMSGTIRDAEDVVVQLEDFLHAAGRDDLSREELETLRREYSQWLRLQNGDDIV